MSRTPPTAWAYSLGGSPGARVLELGADGGDDAEALCAAGGRVTSVRREPGEAVALRARGLDAAISADGSALGVPPAAFDLVVISPAFLRAVGPAARRVDLATAVRAAAGALAPGGALAISLPNPLLAAVGGAFVRRAGAGAPLRSPSPIPRTFRGARELDRALAAAGLESSGVYATIPDPDRPRYLLPLRHRAAAGSFLRTLAAQLPGGARRVAARIAARASERGVLDLLAPGFHATARKPGGDPTRARPPWLVEELIVREAEPIVGAARARALRFVFAAGWRMDGTTLAALAFDPGRARPAFVAKLATGERVAAAEVRRDQLEFLGRALGPELRASVPRLLRHASLPGATLVFESALAGEPLRLPRSARPLEELVNVVSDWLVRFGRSAGPGAVVPDEATFARILVRPFDAYLARFRPGPEERAFLGRLRSEAAALRGSPIPLHAAHGDFCPANLLLERGELRVLDWEEPLRPELPARDLIHFLACIGGARGTTPGYESFEEVFFSSNPRAGIARRALAAHAAALELPPSLLEICFALFWIDYAVEKATVAADRSVAAGARNAWSLARIERDTCLNVERLARAGPEFFLRRPA